MKTSQHDVYDMQVVVRTFKRGERCLSEVGVPGGAPMDLMRHPEGVTEGEAHAEAVAAWCDVPWQ